MIAHRQAQGKKPRHRRPLRRVTQRRGEPLQEAPTGPSPHPALHVHHLTLEKPRPPARLFVTSQSTRASFFLWGQGIAAPTIMTSTSPGIGPLVMEKPKPPRACRGILIAGVWTLLCPYQPHAAARRRPLVGARPRPSAYVLVPDASRPAIRKDIALHTAWPNAGMRRCAGGLGFPEGRWAGAVASVAARAGGGGGDFPAPGTGTPPRGILPCGGVRS